MVVLRWILVLPTALAAAVVARFLFVTSGHWWFTGPSIFDILWSVLGFYVAGRFFCSVGVLVSPTHQKVVAWSLGGIVLVVFGALMMANLLLAPFDWIAAAEGVGLVWGAVAAIVRTQDDEHLDAETFLSD